MNLLSEWQTVASETKTAEMPVGQGRQKKKIFILEDHPMIRQGIRKLIESHRDFEVCGDAASGERALEFLSPLNPDLVIADLSLKDSSGIDFIKSARARFPNLRMLVFSMHEDPAIIERTLKIGANGYVSKVESLESLMDAIRQVLRGEHYLSGSMKKKLLDNEFSSKSEREASIASLSDREIEVLQMLATGQPISRIAFLMHLSVKTVDGYCAHIRKKLGLHNNQELIVEAGRRLPGG